MLARLNRNCEKNISKQHILKNFYNVNIPVLKILWHHTLYHE